MAQHAEPALQPLPGMSQKLCSDFGNMPPIERWLLLTEALCKSPCPEGFLSEKLSFLEFWKQQALSRRLHWQKPQSGWAKTEREKVEEWLFTARNELETSIQLGFKGTIERVVGQSPTNWFSASKTDLVLLYADLIVNPLPCLGEWPLTSSYSEQPFISLCQSGKTKTMLGFYELAYLPLPSFQTDEDENRFLISEMDRVIQNQGAVETNEWLNADENEELRQCIIEWLQKIRTKIENLALTETNLSLKQIVEATTVPFTRTYFLALWVDIVKHPLNLNYKTIFPQSNGKEKKLEKDVLLALSKLDKPVTIKEIVDYLSENDLRETTEASVKTTCNALKNEGKVRSTQKDGRTNYWEIIKSCKP